MRIATLAELLAPVDQAAFLSETWGRCFSRLTGHKAKFSGLFSWEDLNAALEQHRFRTPRLRLEKNKSRIDEAVYTVERPTRRGETIFRLDARQIYRELRDGATLVLDAVDELSGSVARLSESLTSTFLTHVQVNAYASWAETPGFGLHWDDHDVLVLQIFGHKRWKVFPPTRPFPLYRDIQANDQRPAAPVWDGVLEQGDALYIPRGHWHEAVGMNAATLHLTFGIANPTGITLLSWLADELRASELWRADLPLFGDDAAKHSQSLKTSLLASLSDDIVDRYVQWMKSTMTARPHFCLPDAVIGKIDPNRQLRFSGMTYANVTEADGVFSFDALGRAWSFRADLRPILIPLLQGKQLGIEALYALGHPKLDRHQIHRAVTALIAEGLLALVPCRLQS